MKRITLFICLIFFVQISFSQETGSFKDARDGNVYNTVKIFDQIWMSENLNYQIPGATYYQNNSDAYIHGKLYTWDAAVKACPEGWHLPTDDEWKVLESNLGMSAEVLDKSSFRTAPQAYDAIRTNGSSGLDLTLSGWRSANRRFYHLYQRGVYWTSSVNRQNEGWFRYIDEHKAIYRRYERKNFSYSVRCISDSDNQLSYNNNNSEIINNNNSVIFVDDNTEITNNNNSVTLIDDNTEINNNEPELVNNGKYALNSIAELEELLKNAVRERKCDEAVIILTELENRKPYENTLEENKTEENTVEENNINENKAKENTAEKTDEELNNLIKELVEKEDSQKAEEIKEALDEGNKAYLNYSLEELKKMEEEAIAKEDYEIAEKIKKEIERRSE